MQCTYGHARYDVIYEILKLKSRVAKLDFFIILLYIILSNIKACVVEGIDNAKKWIVNAVNEVN
jgi:hypothetical protein